MCVCVCMCVRASVCVYTCAKQAEIYLTHRKNKLHRFIFISLPHSNSENLVYVNLRKQEIFYHVFSARGHCQFILSFLKQEQLPWCQDCRQRGGRSKTIKGARWHRQPEVLPSTGRKFKHRAAPLLPQVLKLPEPVSLSQATLLSQGWCENKMRNMCRGQAAQAALLWRVLDLECWENLTAEICWLYPIQHPVSLLLGTASPFFLRQPPVCLPVQMVSLELTSSLTIGIASGQGWPVRALRLPASVTGSGVVM